MLMCLLSLAVFPDDRITLHGWISTFCTAFSSECCSCGVVLLCCSSCFLLFHLTPLPHTRCPMLPQYANSFPLSLDSGTHSDGTSVSTPSSLCASFHKMDIEQVFCNPIIQFPFHWKSLWDDFIWFLFFHNPSSSFSHYSPQIFIYIDTVRP